jgi:cystathionine beta-lyase/cystathionine gamma-synthase
MPRHDANGRLVAAWLANRLGEGAVHYPGLESHPQHALAARQMSGFGGLVSVERVTRERAAHVLEHVHLFLLAESLGGVESLVNYPALMTHASIPADRRAALGITDGLIRFSCGVEDSDDLIADLDQAFRGL